MQILKCPICRVGELKIMVMQGNEVDFDLAKANQKIVCPICKRKISYSVQPIK
jgi:uncharacterized protein YbaR (Trm112 family)